MNSAHQRTTVYDVAIAGSGPAGTSAARQLALSGAHVIIFEKNAIPRYKPCGGGVVRRVFSRLPFTLDGAIREYCYTAQVNHLDIDLHLSVVHAEPIVAMTMRDEFDALLLSCACSAGVTLLPQCEVITVEQFEENVKIVTTQGEFHARFVIAADGAMGTIARKAGWQETRPLIPALEYEVYLPEYDRSAAAQARFDFGIVDCGYGWVFPKKDHLSIGMLTLLPNSVNLNQGISRYMKVLGYEHADRIERHGYIIPWRPRTEGFIKHRILLVGDAAGFVDPVTGEGISYALLSGQLAAEAIVEGNFNPARVTERYNHAIRTSIVRELSFGVFLSKFLYHSQLRRYVFRKFGRELCETMVSVMSGETSYSKILLNPASYISLLFGRA